METDYCLIALTTDRKIGKEFEERLTDLVSLNRDFQLVGAHTGVSQVNGGSDSRINTGLRVNY